MMKYFVKFDIFNYFCSVFHFKLSYIGLFVWHFIPIPAHHILHGLPP